MVQGPLTGTIHGCPGEDDLCAFDRGRLSRERLDDIAEHLSRCETCQSRLEALNGKDTIQMYLRGQGQAPSIDESACRAMADRARDIPLEEPPPPARSEASGRKAVERPSLPVAFGGYVLLEQLGQGGMGVVFKARQESLKRLVALKMVRTGVYADAQERARFQREGEAIARVRHGNVVQIHEFGEHNGQLYFSMELLAGGTLAARLNGQPMPPREAVELVRTLARAVHEAHEQGVVHRDLKPGNVLFASDGTAKVTDFGLAKMLDTEDGETISEAILGTPAYMAPEQARGEVRAVGPLSDVYALGAILYECLTGQPPFKAETKYRTLELVRTDELVPPSRLRPALPPDLEAICVKCLEKEASRRYPSAAEVADELDRWLRGEPTRVRPPGFRARSWRRAQRHPRASVSVILAFLVPLVGLPVWYYRLEPRKPIWEFERQLRRGETVTLIGETGGPRWSRWGIQAGVSNLSRLQDGTFSVFGQDDTLLTLLPDPQRSYRFGAEVRHERQTSNGAVGLSFLHSVHDLPYGKEHFFCVLTFNDLEAALPDPITGEMSSPLEFKVVRVTEFRRDGVSEAGPDKIAYVFRRLFVPAWRECPGKYPWRRLAVEVRPTGVDLYWEEEHLAHIPHDTILTHCKDTKEELVGGRFVDPLPDLHPTFSPRDALGLFVCRGQASFRRVEVKPLSEP
jgi:serine/threonine protein kinase